MLFRSGWRAACAQAVGSALDLAVFGTASAALPRVRASVECTGADCGAIRCRAGWLPGEFIVDEHQVQLPAALPAGSYALQAGLYDAASGQRLHSSSNPAGTVLLQPVQVAAP